MNRRNASQGFSPITNFITEYTNIASEAGHATQLLATQVYTPLAKLPAFDRPMSQTASLKEVSYLTSRSLKQEDYTNRETFGMDANLNPSSRYFTYAHHQSYGVNVAWAQQHPDVFATTPAQREWHYAMEAYMTGLHYQGLAAQDLGLASISSSASLQQLASIYQQLSAGFFALSAHDLQSAAKEEEYDLIQARGGIPSITIGGAAYKFTVGLAKLWDYANFNTSEIVGEFVDKYGLIYGVTVLDPATGQYTTVSEYSLPDAFGMVKSVRRGGRRHGGGGRGAYEARYTPVDFPFLGSVITQVPAGERFFTLGQYVSPWGAAKITANNLLYEQLKAADVSLLQKYYQTRPAYSYSTYAQPTGMEEGLSNVLLGFTPFMRGNAPQWIASLQESRLGLEPLQAAVGIATGAYLAPNFMMAAEIQLYRGGYLGAAPPGTPGLGGYQFAGQAAAYRGFAQTSLAFGNLDSYNSNMARSMYYEAEQQMSLPYAAWYGLQAASYITSGTSNAIYGYNLRLYGWLAAVAGRSLYEGAKMAPYVSQMTSGAFSQAVSRPNTIFSQQYGYPNPVTSSIVNIEWGLGFPLGMAALGGYRMSLGQAAGVSLTLMGLNLIEAEDVPLINRLMAGQPTGLGWNLMNPQGLTPSGNFVVGNVLGTGLTAAGIYLQYAARSSHTGMNPYAGPAFNVGATSEWGGAGEWVNPSTWEGEGLPGSNFNIGSAVAAFAAYGAANWYYNNYMAGPIYKWLGGNQQTYDWRNYQMVYAQGTGRGAGRQGRIAGGQMVPGYMASGLSPADWTSIGGMLFSNAAAIATQIGMPLLTRAVANQLPDTVSSFFGRFADIPIEGVALTQSPAQYQRSQSAIAAGISLIPGIGPSLASGYSWFTELVGRYWSMLPPLINAGTFPRMGEPPQTSTPLPTNPNLEFLQLLGYTGPSLTNLVNQFNGLSGQALITAQNTAYLNSPSQVYYSKLQQQYTDYLHGRMVADTFIGAFQYTNPHEQQAIEAAVFSNPDIVNQASSMMKQDALKYGKPLASLASYQLGVLADDLAKGDPLKLTQLAPAIGAIAAWAETIKVPYVSSVTMNRNYDVGGRPTPKMGGYTAHLGYHTGFQVAANYLRDVSAWGGGLSYSYNALASAQLGHAIVSWSNDSIVGYDVKSGYPVYGSQAVAMASGTNPSFFGFSGYNNIQWYHGPPPSPPTLPGGFGVSSSGMLYYGSPSWSAGGTLIGKGGYPIFSQPFALPSGQINPNLIPFGSAIMPYQYPPIMGTPIPGSYVNAYGKTIQLTPSGGYVNIAFGGIQGAVAGQDPTLSKLLSKAMSGPTVLMGTGGGAGYGGVLGIDLSGPLSADQINYLKSLGFNVPAPNQPGGGYTPGTFVPYTGTSLLGTYGARVPAGYGTYQGLSLQDLLNLGFVGMTKTQAGLASSGIFSKTGVATIGSGMDKQNIYWNGSEWLSEDEMTLKYGVDWRLKIQGGTPEGPTGYQPTGMIFHQLGFHPTKTPTPPRTATDPRGIGPDTEGGYAYQKMGLVWDPSYAGGTGTWMTPDEYRYIHHTNPPASTVGAQTGYEAVTTKSTYIHLSEYGQPEYVRVVPLPIGTQPQHQLWTSLKAPIARFNDNDSSNTASPVSKVIDVQLGKSVSQGDPNVSLNVPAIKKIVVDTIVGLISNGVLLAHPSAGTGWDYPTSVAVANSTWTPMANKIYDRATR